MSVSDHRTGCNRHPKAGSDFQIIQRIKSVLTDKTLDFSERCALAHLMLSAGTAGETIRKHETLAAELGLSERQSKRLVRRLADSGHIRSQQRGLRRANRYVMPWHPGAEAQPATDPEQEAESVPEVTPTAPLEVTPMALQEVTPMALPIGKEPSGKEVSGEDKTTSSEDVARASSLFEPYTEITGKKLTCADRRLIVRFTAENPDVDRWAVRAGIAATLVRSEQPGIRSIAYFFREIRRIMDETESPEQRRNYSQHCVLKWQRYSPVKGKPPEVARAAAA